MPRLGLIIPHCLGKMLLSTLPSAGIFRFSVLAGEDKHYSWHCVDTGHCSL